MGQCCSTAPTGEDQEFSIHKRHLARHFKLLKKLGTGSWGSVFLVERIADGKRYALKQTTMTDLTEHERWIAVNEIRVMASLEPHPHLVNCNEGFLDGEHLCIVMELMPRGELAHIIERHAEKDTFMPEAQVWSYFIQVALGVKFLHAHGVIHRDLKPANILVGEEGQLKIADMGVAHVVRVPKGSTKVQIGTPHYMAPEVWRRDPYSFSADIWALGCILHEMCYRKPLFIAPTEQEVESRVIAGVIPPISRRYSQDLKDLITRLLEYSAADRPDIDAVLSCDAVRSRLSTLTEESMAALKGIDLDLETAASSVLDPIEIPADLSLLNLRLPPSRYSLGEGLVTVLAAESSLYRAFTLGPPELPTFTMPRPAPKVSYLPPPPPDAAADSAATAAEGSAAAAAAGGDGGVSGEGVNPVATTPSWDGQCNAVVPQRETRVLKRFMEHQD